MYAHYLGNTCGPQDGSRYAGAGRSGELVCVPAAQRVRTRRIVVRRRPPRPPHPPWTAPGPAPVRAGCCDRRERAPRGTGGSCPTGGPSSVPSAPARPRLRHQGTARRPDHCFTPGHPRQVHHGPGEALGTVDRRRGNRPAARAVRGVPEQRCVDRGGQHRAHVDVLGPLQPRLLTQARAQGPDGVLRHAVSVGVRLTSPRPRRTRRSPAFPGPARASPEGQPGRRARTP